MACGERGIRKPSALCRQVVPLAADDLAVEHRRKTAHQVGVRAAVKVHLFVVAHPIEVAPHFAPVHLFGAFLGRKHAQCSNHFECRGNVRLMLVREVVRIEMLRLCPSDTVGKFFDDFGIASVLYLFGRVPEQKKKAVLSHTSRLLLFDDAHFLHLFVRIVGVKPASRTPSTVRHDDRAEPLVLIPETLHNGRVRHKFNVVLMRGDRKVGGT